jgi:glycosyltransferase involved in cell wall biosynthesis
MKILHLIQRRQLRGAEVFASQLAAHTCRMGHEAILVPLFGGDTVLPFEGRIIPLKASRERRFWDIGAWRRLARIIREERPDVIQANAGDTIKYAVLSKLICRWRQPILFRNASTISLYIRTRLTRWMNLFFFRKVDKIISVSNASATDFEWLFPECRGKVISIPIGIEEGTMDGEQVLAEAHRSGGPILVHVGGFTYEKNHIRLFNMFERILEENRSASLHLIGDGPLKKDMEDIAVQKGLDKQIHFYGSRKDAIQFIREADVLLLPSIIEGLPAAILEAFFCRTPVVAYDVGGVKEIVGDRMTGRLIPRNDEDAFIQAVLSMLCDDEQRSIMTRNAYQLVTSGYLNKDIAARFLKVYKSILHYRNNPKK